MAIPCKLSLQAWGQAVFLCKTRRKTFHVGRVGKPVTNNALFVPRETACYECLIGRENANLEKPDGEKALRAGAFRSRGYAGFHPAMASVLGDFAAMELIKFTTDVIPWRIGALFEVNLLSPELTTRRVLKLPRCAVCGVQERHPGTSALARALGVLPETYRETAVHGKN